MPDIEGCYGWMADSIARRFLGLWLLRNQVDQNTPVLAQ